MIGGGWAAYFLARGYRVVAWDPAEDAEPRLRHLVTAAWPALTELGLAEGAGLDNLTVERELAAACGQADFVQESAPEDLELKRTLLADIDAVTSEGIVIASSTSSYWMSEIQTRCAHPERTVVAHPFDPPYLIPLVEVVGGTATDDAVVQWTAEFFRHAGKSVMTLDREVPDFIAHRLQEALSREARHLLSAGEATVEQIEQSFTEGPGLLWPVLGPMLTCHELTPDCRDGRSLDDVVAERDRGVVAVLRALGRV